MTISPEELSRLIGDIYDAALDASLWPQVLQKTADFVGAQGAGLLTKGSVSHAGTVHYQVGVDPAYVERYETEMWRYDPIAPLVMFAVGEVTSRLDYLPDAEFQEGRFQREWAGPQGWVDSASTVVEKSPEVFSVLSYLRSEAAGMVDDEMRQRVRLLFPHIRRSVLIGHAIDLRTAEAAQFAATLDAVRAGVFLLDGAGRRVHANRAGEDMLARGLFSDGSGRLVAADAAADRELRAASAASAAGGDAIGASAVALEMHAPGGERYLLHLLPLLAGAREQIGRRHAAVSALFVVQSALHAPSAPELIASAFGLTPSELRVLLAMVEADGVAEIAAALGIAEATVGTHLRHLFAKTGRKRQAELVKLLAEFSNPMLP